MKRETKALISVLAVAHKLRRKGFIEVQGRLPRIKIKGRLILWWIWLTGWSPTAEETIQAMNAWQKHWAMKIKREGATK